MMHLEVKGLCKHYPSFDLKNVSFSVPQGAIVGLIGRNGAGKSTILKSILGMVHADSGEVFFLERPVTACDRFFKENIGVVLGGIDFYPKKKLKTLTEVTAAFYPDWNAEKYRHYTELFHLEENKRVDELSAGMKVKYMIALALSHNAGLLILDEPSSGLDPVSRDELTELFKAIVRDGRHSILFSTHITSDLEKCATHIAMVKDGSLLYAAELPEFLQHFADLGNTLEDIIVSIEKRSFDENAIV